MLRYGKVLNKTLSYRESNPELVYISSVNSCASEFILKNKDTALNGSGNLDFDRFSVNRALREHMLLCFFSNTENSRHLINTEHQLSGLDLSSLSQSEVTEVLGEHDKYVSRFRILD